MVTIFPGNRRYAVYSMSNPGKLKIIDANAPAAMQAFWAFDKAAMADGAIPAKTKELMALAVAFTTQCPYCIEIHSGKARHAGATDAEIAEVVTIAAALRAGAAVTHGTRAFQGA
jgi:AhpD family alkylhydroperoxidase